MKISELLRILRANKKEHGDLVVRIYDLDWRGYYNIEAKEIAIINDEGDNFLCFNVPSD